MTRDFLVLLASDRAHIIDIFNWRDVEYPLYADLAPCIYDEVKIEITCHCSLASLVFGNGSCHAYFTNVCSSREREMIDSRDTRS